MATLSTNELVSVRQAAAEVLTVNFTKAQINAAAQAVETFISQQAATISAAIDTATSPFSFSNTQKKKIVAEVVRLKYDRDK